MRFGLMVLLLSVLSCRSQPHLPQKQQKKEVPAPALETKSEAGPSVTRVFIHSVLLHKGPDFSVRIQWLRGHLERTRAPETPSLDDVSSFAIRIEAGVIGAGLDEVNGFLNKSSIASPALTNLKLSTNHGQIRLTGMFHKVLPLPIEVSGDLAANPDGRVRIHVKKIDVLKLPVKGLLSAFKVKTADLISPKAGRGLEVSGDDILLDSSRMLPPPHLTGALTEVQIRDGEIVEIFGNGREQTTEREQWRNFLRFRGGDMSFGKLLMHDADIIMIDTSADKWFNLDLDHYQQQIVYGYSRLTPQAGLQIFMPDLNNIPHRADGQRASMEWVKHRNTPPPASVLPR